MSSPELCTLSLHDALPICIALAKCEPDQSCDIFEVVSLAGGTFSAQLTPKIAELLEKHHFQKKDIGADRKSTRLNSSHITISYAVFCLKKKKHLGMLLIPV